jgi:hypothetical protein
MLWEHEVVGSNPTAPTNLPPHLALPSARAYAANLVDDPAPRRPNVILGEWRAAERTLRDARVAMEQASDVAERLRNEHGRSVLRYRDDSLGEP